MSKIDRAIKGALLLPKGFGSALTLKELRKDERQVSGFDIEADAITAEPFLLGYSTDGHEGHIVFDSTDAKTNALKVIDIHTRFSFRQSINFYYNLQYDFEGMLKMFPKEVAILLYGQTSAFIDEDVNALTIEKSKEDKLTYTYKLSYIPKKAFHIKIRGDKKYSYFDLLQYYQMGLAKASAKYLKDDKKDFKAGYTSKALFECRSTIEFEILRFGRHIRNNELLTAKEKEKKLKEMEEFFRSFSSPQEYRQQVIEYCIHDASLCRQLGHIIVDGINTFVNTKNFNSSATISEYYFRSHGLLLPKLAPHILQDAMRNYYGGRFENMKKGYIRNVSIYDIKSAYPFAMSTMPILSANPIVKNVYSLHEEALFGTYNINVEIPKDTYISPLSVREQLLYFPNGKYTNYHVDKITLKTLLDNGYDVKLNEALEIYDDNAEPLLYDLILKLFAIKEDKSNPEVIRLAAKIILNSLYGKFIQLVDDTGIEIINDLEELDKVSPAELFNICNRYYKRIHTNNFKTGKLFGPYYASHTTAHTRNYIWNTAKNIGQQNTIAFHTDSLMCIGNDRIKTGHKLGDWELESLKAKDKSVPVSDSELWLLKSGFYQVKKDNILKLRARGVGNTTNLLQDKFTVKRRIGMKQSIKKNFERMNIIEEQSIDNNIDSDSKRVWDSSITLEDIEEGAMIDSMPRVIDMDAMKHEKEAVRAKRAIQSKVKLRASNYRNLIPQAAMADVI